MDYGNESIEHRQRDKVFTSEERARIDLKLKQSSSYKATEYELEKINKKNKKTEKQLEQENRAKEQRKTAKETKDNS